MFYYGVKGPSIVNKSTLYNLFNVCPKLHFDVTHMNITKIVEFILVVK